MFTVNLNRIMTFTKIGNFRCVDKAMRGYVRIKGIKFALASAISAQIGAYYLGDKFHAFAF